MNQISLTQGQVAVVDDWRYEELSQWKWHAYWDPHTQSFYATRNVRGSTVSMHRQIMNTPKGMICDHINHDTLDNQEHNLRNVTYSQNALNARPKRKNKLNQKNICIHKNGFRVRVTLKGKMVFSKYFGSLHDALAARDTAVEQFHGEYAYQNNP